MKNQWIAGFAAIVILSFSMGCRSPGDPATFEQLYSRIDAVVSDSDRAESIKSILRGSQDLLEKKRHDVKQLKTDFQHLVMDYKSSTASVQEKFKALESVEANLFRALQANILEVRSKMSEAEWKQIVSNKRKKN